MHKLGPCLVIPFRDPTTGNFTKYHRLKPDNPRDEGAVKYESPRGSTSHAYIPPGTFKTLANASAPLLITEGEKKAAKADQEGFACVGISGVWNWQKGWHEPTDPGRSRTRQLIDDLAGVTWNGRQVYLCFDSDLADNLNVRLAEWDLSETLEQLGATVKVVRLPQGTDGTKTGLDDYLVANSRAALQSLLDESQPLAADQKPSPPVPSEACYRSSTSKRQVFSGPWYEGVGEGRGKGLYRYASSLRARGASDATLHREIHQANTTLCFPPLRTREVDRIIRKVCKFERGTPDQFGPEGEFSYFGDLPGVKLKLASKTNAPDSDFAQSDFSDLANFTPLPPDPYEEEEAVRKKLANDFHQAQRERHRAERGGHRYCPNQRKSFVLVKDGPDPDHMLNAVPNCWSWSCPYCRPGKIQEKLTNARLHFQQVIHDGEQLHVIVVNNDQVRATLRKLRYATGKYGSVDMGGYKTAIYTDAGIAGSTAITIDDAIAQIKTRLDNLPELFTGRAVNWSKDWSIEETKRKLEASAIADGKLPAAKYRRLGDIPTNIPEELREQIAGAPENGFCQTTSISTPTTMKPRIGRVLLIKFGAMRGKRFAERLYQQLALGELWEQGYDPEDPPDINMGRGIPGSSHGQEEIFDGDLTKL